MADKNQIYGIDPPELIRACLACPRSECINCLRRAAGKPSIFVRNAPVYQYSPETMALIREWPSASEASRATGIDQGSISSAIHGRIKTAGGFIWRREE